MPDRSATVPLAIGTKTPWGSVSAVQWKDGERYYFLNKDGAFSYMPAEVVERAC